MYSSKNIRNETYRFKINKFTLHSAPGQNVSNSLNTGPGHDFCLGTMQFHCLYNDIVQNDFRGKLIINDSVISMKYKIQINSRAGADVFAKLTLKSDKTRGPYSIRNTAHNIKHHGRCALYSVSYGVYI